MNGLALAIEFNARSGPQIDLAHGSSARASTFRTP